MWIKIGSIVALLVGAMVSEPIYRHTRGVLCGTQLSEALSLACGSNFYVPRDKRDSSLGLLADTVAQSFLGRHSRQHRGIVEECCHKSCSMQELLSYCGN